MQPDNTDAQQKLAQLPIAAMEALLGSDELKVASENTAVAVATFWLQQEVLHTNTSESSSHQRRLMDKLRLCHCSPSYLTSCLRDSDRHYKDLVESAGFTSVHYWLREQLDADQRWKLIWGANRVAVVRAATGREVEPRSMEELQGAAQIGAGSCWCQVARPLSKVVCGKMHLEVTLSELAAQGMVLSKPCWYGGYSWDVRVTWPEESSSSSSNSSSSIGSSLTTIQGF